MKVLITGANGFIGRHLCEHLAENGCQVTALSRSPWGASRERIHPLVVPELSPHTEFRGFLKNHDAVVHLAARAHVAQDTATNARGNSIERFRRANVELTEKLARDALAVGVGRFVFVSSIGVLGNRTTDAPFHRHSSTAPVEDYAVSKRDAEECLRSLFDRGGDDGGDRLVIVRPPLVYGPGVKGNFQRLIQLVERLPVLPLGGVRVARSYLHVRNLCGFIARCLDKRLAGGTYLVCDGEDLTLPELIRMIAAGLNKRRWLVPVPPAWLRLLGAALGKRAEIDRLTHALTVDADEDQQLAQWTPTFRPQHGIHEMVEHYRRKAA